MLAKFSVKKPMTVLVAVILVVILGAVSFTRMTPDLLPNIDFPYVIVVTTCTGASPEKIEGTITKPVEQAAATLDGIKQVDSRSNENYSMVMLQFAGDANMDASTMNLREKLDQLSASWPEETGTPVILKINPNMLPINVSAVAREGYDTVALSDFVTETLLPQLEGIEGVASVSLSGSVFERVNVVIRQEKIDRLNQRIRAAIDEEFAEPEQELADAQQEIAEGEAKLDSGERKLRTGKKELREGEAAANAQFKSAQQQIDEGKSQLNTAIDGLKKLISLGESYDSLVAARDALRDSLAALPPDQQPAEDKAKLQELEASVSAAAAARADLSANRAALSAAEAQLATLAESQKALDVKKTQTAAELAAAEKQLNSGSRQIKNAREELSEAQEQLDEAAEELSEAKQDAYDAADANDIVTLETVASILGAQDFSMPAGYVTEDGVDWLVYVGDSFQSAEELNGLILLDLGLDGLEPVCLSDVAEVLIADNADSTYARINGSDGVLLTFNKQSNYATATVSENILNAFDGFRQRYEGLSFTTLMDQGDYIHLVVNSVLQNLLIGAALAVLILLLFLRDIRPTFIIACSIPISLTFAVALMYFSGVTLNVISMSGLAVGVGMLVDNSIVVIENIYRLRKNGESVYRAAISGAAQVAAAITASTLTTVCVFLPIVFVEGMTRQLFADMALTIGYSLLASLIVALTLIPALSSGVLRRVQEQKKPALFDRLARLYTRLLAVVLRHKAPVLLLSLLLLLLSGYAAISRGFAYMPEMDSTQISLDITLDETATLADSAAMADEICERFSALPYVDTVGVMQSQGLGGMVGLSAGASANELEMYVVLRSDKEKTSAAIANELESLCADLDCEVSASSSGMDMSALSGSGITVNLYGEDLDGLQRCAREVAGLLAQVPGVETVSDGLERTTPELSIRVDKEKAMRQGLTTAQVYMEIAKAIRNESTAASVADSGNDVVIVADEAGVSVSDIKNLVLTLTDREGKKQRVPLRDIAVFSEGETLQSIARSEQRRYLSITAALKPGHNVTLVTADAERALAGYALPEGFRLEFSGENETIMEAMNDLLLMLLLGIVFVYLIMVAQFQSLLSPFIVMLTIPLAFTGGLLALLVAGFEISIVSMIGFVMLVGIIVNNGIVLIDCMNQLRQGGMERREAVLEACRLRLRPVLMTALTTILGLIPMAMGAGLGASLIQPVAVVSIGGLVYATLMTLFIVPAIYDAWCKKPPRAVSAEDLVPVREDAPAQPAGGENGPLADPAAGESAVRRGGDSPR